MQSSSMFLNRLACSPGILLAIPFCLAILSACSPNPSNYLQSPPDFKIDNGVSYKIYQKGEIAHNCGDIPECVRIDIVSSTNCDMLSVRLDFYGDSGKLLGDGVEHHGAKVNAGERLTLSIYPLDVSHFQSTKMNEISCIVL